MNKKLSQSTLDFIANLEEYREWMEAERKETTDKAFMDKYSVTYDVLNKYMWPAPVRNISRSHKVVLDVSVVNSMRMVMSDTEIRDFFRTSTKNLTNQCGHRSEHWIPLVMRKRWQKLKESIESTKRTYKSRKKYIKDVALNTDRWETPKISEYELSWMKEAVDLNRPHPSLYEKMNK